MRTSRMDLIDWAVLVVLVGFGSLPLLMGVGLLIRALRGC